MNKTNKNIIDTLKDSELNSLRECVKDIDNLTILRTVLHNDILKNIESIKSDINSFIMGIDPRNNPEAVQEIVKLKQQQVNLEQFKLQERVNEWRDIADLKREKRERELELRELENRSKIFEDL